MSDKNVIEVKAIDRIFPVPGGEFQALKEIDAAIKEGSFAILKGRSGSGKTTLLNIIGALDIPTRGTVLIDGKDIASMSENERENCAEHRWDLFSSLFL